MKERKRESKQIPIRLYPDEKEDRKVIAVLDGLPKNVSRNHFIKTAILEYYDNRANPENDVHPLTLNELQSFTQSDLVTQEAFSELTGIVKKLADKPDVSSIVQQEITKLRSDLFSLMASGTARPVAFSEVAPAPHPVEEVPDNGEINGIELSPDILAFVTNPS